MPTQRLVKLSVRPADRLTDPATSGYVVLLASTLVILAFWLQGDIGLNTRDEGYLWYGVLRTSAGEVPIRDFRSYDPGRYYWLAGLSSIGDNSLMDIRRSAALAQLIGLAAGLLAATRVTRNRASLALLAIVLLAWMIPRHKVFESSIAMIAVWLGVRLLERPSRSRCVWAGVFVGLAAIFGRNLGAYSGLALFGLLAYRGAVAHRSATGDEPLEPDEERLDWRASLVFFLAGIVLGYSPILAMVALDGGFRIGFWKSILFYLGPGGGNFALPVPWPWRLEAGLRSWQSVAQMGVGVGFILLVAFPLVAAAALIAFHRKRRHDARLRSAASLLAASAAVSIFYSHHAFSRADLSHFAQSVHPMWLGVVALAALAKRWVQRPGLAATFTVMPAVVLVATLPAALTHNPVADFLREPAAFTRFDAGDDDLWIPRRQARHLTGLRELIDDRVAGHEELLVIPYEPGMYPVLGRTAPVWDPYPIRPQTESRQRAMIRSLEEKRVDWALIYTSPIDGREELSFPETHPLVWEHMLREFEPLDVPTRRHDETMWRRRSTRPGPR